MIQCMNDNREYVNGLFVSEKTVHGMLAFCRGVNLLPPPPPLAPYSRLALAITCNMLMTYYHCAAWQQGGDDKLLYLHMTTMSRSQLGTHSGPHFPSLI